MTDDSSSDPVFVAPTTDNTFEDRVHVAPSLSAPMPVVEHATPAPVDVCTETARLIEHVAPSPVIDCIAPVSAASGVSADFENPQFPVLAVEPAVSQVVDSFSFGVMRVQFAMEPSASKAAVSFPAVDVSALPLHEQVHQEQFAAVQFVESF